MLRAMALWLAMPWRMFGFGLGLMRAAAEQMATVFETVPGAVGAPAETTDQFRPALGPADAAWTAPAGALPASPPVVETREAPMSYENRDTDLSGDDLKVVEYTIVTVQSDLKDEQRVLTSSPLLIAVSDDMRPEDFATWVVSKWLQEENHPIEHDKKRYLRVCYRVMCRLKVSEEKEVDVLRDIQRTLAENNRGSAVPRQATDSASSGRGNTPADRARTE